MRLQHIINNITKENLEILYSKFGYSALGYYYEIINILSQNNILIYEINKLNKLSRDLKIPRKKLENFIKECSKIYNKNGFSLLRYDNKYFWCDSLIYNKQTYKNRIKSIKNKGRPKYSIKDSINIEYAKFVNLTLKQYEKIQHKYGAIFAKNAIYILNSWLKEKGPEAKKYLNKNNYGHFRSDSWVINETKRLLEYYEYNRICTPDGNILINKLL